MSDYSNLTTRGLNKLVGFFTGKANIIRNLFSAAFLVLKIVLKVLLPVVVFVDMIVNFAITNYTTKNYLMFTLTKKLSDRHKGDK